MIVPGDEDSRFVVEENPEYADYHGEVRPIYEAMCNSCGYPNRVRPTSVTFICRQCGKEQEK